MQKFSTTKIWSHTVAKSVTVHSVIECSYVVEILLRILDNLISNKSAYMG